MGGVTPHCRIGGVAILLPLDARVFTQLVLGDGRGYQAVEDEETKRRGRNTEIKEKRKREENQDKKVQRETQVNVWRGTESFELEALARPWKEGINE